MNIPGVLEVYTDGGCIGPNPSPIGGTWAYRLVGASDEIIHCDSGVIMCDPGESVTNNLSELIAIVEALKRLPAGWSGKVCSDSKISLGRMFKGWRMRNIPLWLIVSAEAERRRINASACIPELLKGHPSKALLAAGSDRHGNRVSIHNVMCDKECSRLTRLILARKAAAEQRMAA